jgi:hypothetical protein
METLIKLWAVFLGFGAFLVVWSRIVRWGHSVWVAFRDRHSPSSSKSALPIVLFFHSGPWLLALTAFLTFRVLSSPHRPEWAWFFGGGLLVPPAIAFLVLRVLRRQRQAKVARVEP